MSVNVADQNVVNTEAYARRWCSAASIPPQDIDDYIREAHVASLENDGDRRAIKAALQRMKYAQFGAPVPFAGPDGNDRPARDGLVYDSYHGWCRDDV